MCSYITASCESLLQLYQPVSSLQKLWHTRKFTMAINDVMQLLARETILYEDALLGERVIYLKVLRNM